MNTPEESTATLEEESKVIMSDPDVIIFDGELPLLGVHKRSLCRAVSGAGLNGERLGKRWGWPHDSTRWDDSPLILGLSEKGLNPVNYRFRGIHGNLDNLLNSIQEKFKDPVTMVQFINPPVAEESNKVKNKFNIDDKVVIKQDIGFWLCDPEGRENKRSIIRRVSGLFEDKVGRYRYYLDGVMSTTYTEEDLSSDIRGEVERRIISAVKNTREKATIEIERLEGVHKFLLKVLAGDTEEKYGIGDVHY